MVKQKGSIEQDLDLGMTMKTTEEIEHQDERTSKKHAPQFQETSSLLIKSGSRRLSGACRSFLAALVLFFIFSEYSSQDKDPMEVIDWRYPDLMRPPQIRCKNQRPMITRSKDIHKTSISKTCRLEHGGVLKIGDPQPMGFNTKMVHFSG